jgi:chromosomal replication initiator protein
MSYISRFIVRRGPVYHAVERRMNELARNAEIEAAAVEAAAKAAQEANDSIEPEFINSPDIEFGRMTIGKIRGAVCRHFDIRLVDLISHRRTKAVILPRQIGMHLSRVHTTASYPQIGVAFGNRDHTTVIHADRKITVMRETDQYVARHVRHIEDVLGVNRSEEAE